jgi:hypothetical protein
MLDEIESSEVTSVNLEQLTRVYLKIRDAKEELTTKYKAQVAGLDEQLETIEQEINEVCKQMNASSIRTPHGTIIRSVKSRYWTNDWDSLYQVIKEHDAFGLLTKSIHQSNMKEFLAENPAVLPAGLNVENAYSVVVRRSKGN